MYVLPSASTGLLKPSPDMTQPEINVRRQPGTGRDHHRSTWIVGPFVFEFFGRHQNPVETVEQNEPPPFVRNLPIFIIAVGSPRVHGTVHPLENGVMSSKVMDR
jgi:hypothetical protein